MFPDPLKRTFGAAAWYAVTVFAVGFALGTLRVLAVAPRIGDTAAVIVELPMMILVSLVLARRSARRWQVPRTVGARALMGLLAFAILMVCEIVVSTALFGNSLAEHLAGYRLLHVRIGLIGQSLFAAMPILVLVRRDR